MQIGEWTEQDRTEPDKQLSQFVTGFFWRTAPEFLKWPNGNSIFGKAAKERSELEVNSRTLFPPRRHGGRRYISD